MRRLYVQIYLTFIGIVVLFGVMIAVVFWLGRDDHRERPFFDGIGATLVEVLPPAGAPPEAVQPALERLAERFDARLTLRAPDGRLLGAVGRPLPAPPPDMRQSGWMRARGPGPTFAFALPDRRWLVVRPDRDRHRDRTGFFLVAIGLLAVAIGLGAYPLVRRLTGRLERLQTQVDALGGGDLTARVTVEGRDEIAALAQSFNSAVARIEKLVAAQKDILASASHELRSPLTRIRMAIELLAGDNNAPIHDKVAADIAELDDLIEELLLASRLDTADELTAPEPVDLLGLVAEEARHYDANVAGDAVEVIGDGRLLRRLARNLFENAARYGDGAPIEAEVAAGNSHAVLRVMDRGPGVPADERERIFEPFYRRPGMREGIDKGVGLGLALVRRIAERHGGAATCRPRDGGGTIFEVTLSRHTAAD